MCREWERPFADPKKHVSREEKDSIAHADGRSTTSRTNGRNARNRSRRPKSLAYGTAGSGRGTRTHFRCLPAGRYQLCFGAKYLARGGIDDEDPVLARRGVVTVGAARPEADWRQEEHELSVAVVKRLAPVLLNRWIRRSAGSPCRYSRPYRQSSTVENASATRGDRPSQHGPNASNPALVRLFRVRRLCARRRAGRSGR